MNQIPRHARQKLKYYVYLYVDPRDGQPFYVGKDLAQRERAVAGADDMNETFVALLSRNTRNWRIPR